MNKPVLSVVEHDNLHAVNSLDDLRIVVASPSKAQLDQIVRTLLGTVGASNISTLEGGVQQLGTLASQSVPDVLIVDGVDEDCDDLAPLERLSQLYPSMAFIILSEQQSPEFLIRAMRAGVREVLPSAPHADALKAALQRIQLKMGLSSSRKGKILAFISCKGGSGATFLAANLAHALATHGNKKVALIDLNLQFGEALLFLSNLKPATTLTDVARGIHRLDAAFLAASMVRVDLTLSVLAGPEDPARGMEVKPEHIDALLKLARTQYDFVILDVSRNLDAQSIKALDHADKIFPVLQVTLPFIRDGKRLLDVFRTLDYADEKISLVLNRYKKGGDIGIKELEQSLGSKVRYCIPNDYDAVAASVNQGVPIALLARSSPVTKALLEWSDLIAPAPAQQSGNWISRVFKHA